MEFGLYVYFRTALLCLDVFLFTIGIFIFIFLISKLRKNDPKFQSVFFHVLAFEHGTHIIYSICNNYGKMTNFDPEIAVMPAINFYMWHCVSCNGIQEFLQGLNRSTALAFPMFYKKMWAIKYAAFYNLIIVAFPFVVHPYVFWNWDCKFNDSPAPECPPFHQQTNTRIAFVNIGLTILALILIIFGVIKARKNGYKMAQIEKRLLLQAVQSSTLISTLFVMSFFAQAFPPYDFQFYATFVYLTKGYLPMFLLYFGTKTIRQDFLKFYGFNFLAPKRAVIRIPSISVSATQPPRVA